MTDPSLDHVAVMGAGAVGCYFGAMLARAGAAVRLIGRPALAEAVSRDGGLQFNGVEFTGRVPLSATADPAGVAGAGLVLFCVKSADTDKAAAAMAPHLSPGAAVLDLQNGVDNVERIRAQFERARIKNTVVPAVVYVGAEMQAPGVLRHNARGDLVIGEAGARMADSPVKDPALIADLAGWLSARKVPARVSDNIEGELWWKLIVNCAYNAVSAIGQTRYGPMMAIPQMRQVIGDAVREILVLAEAKSVRIAIPNPNETTPSGTDPVETVLRFGDAMPQTKSSTAQDIERGRPTEIDYLNGYVVRECDARGLPAPVNRTLYALVKLLEQKAAHAG